MVNSASFATAAPGSIAAAFGVALTDGVESANSTPLPASLGGATLSIGGLNAPVFRFPRTDQRSDSVGSGRRGDNGNDQFRNAVIDCADGSGLVCTGDFTLNASGKGQGVVVNSITYAWAAPAGSIPGVNAGPVHVGDYITIYCTGLGP